MSEFSIEDNIKKIYNSKTRNYFMEVFRSYNAENYRSAVVMLYSVVICDLIYKLQELKDLYQNKGAEKILNNIEGSKKTKPTSPEWEKKLVEQMLDQNYLDLAVKDNIDYLQHQRNLSAHPILTSCDLLFSPNKETVQGHIRNMIEGLLIVPPIFSKNIIENLTEDLSKNHDIFSKELDLEKFLEAKYFKGMPDYIYNKIFKDLWKLTFKTIDEKCDKNRDILYKTLKIFLKKKKNSIISLIIQEKNYFSSISREGPLQFLIPLLAQNKEIYDNLTDEAKEIIKGGKIDCPDEFFLAWFINGDFSEHIEYLIEEVEINNINIKKKVYKILYSLSDNYYCKDKIIQLALCTFSKSRSFDTADNRFNIFIKPYIEKYNKEQLIKLLGVINNNEQIYSRRAARQDNSIIKNYCDMIFEKNFNYKEFDNFTNNCEL